MGATEVRYTRTPREFHTLLEDLTLEIVDFHHVSQYMDRVVVRRRPEFAKAPRTNCLPVAIFVTSYARLHLYSFMEQVQALGHKLLYCGPFFCFDTILFLKKKFLDTDSLYYVAKNGSVHVAEGEALGQMKRELPDRRIFEFVSGGPKNHGEKHHKKSGSVDDDDVRAELKIRSFRLSYAAHQLLNFESVVDIVMEHYNIDGEM